MDWSKDVEMGGVRSTAPAAPPPAAPTFAPPGAVTAASFEPSQPGYTYVLPRAPVASAPPPSHGGVAPPQSPGGGPPQAMSPPPMPTSPHAAVSPHAIPVATPATGLHPSLTSIVQGMPVMFVPGPIPGTFVPYTGPAPPGGAQPDGAAAANPYAHTGMPYPGTTSAVTTEPVMMVAAGDGAMTVVHAYPPPVAPTLNDDIVCPIMGIVLAFFIPLAGCITLAITYNPATNSRRRRMAGIAAACLGGLNFLLGFIIITMKRGD